MDEDEDARKKAIDQNKEILKSGKEINKNMISAPE